MIKSLSNKDISDVKVIDPRTIIVELQENVTNVMIDTNNLQLKNFSYLNADQNGTPVISKLSLTRTIFNKLIFARKSAYFQESDSIMFCLPEGRIKSLNLENNNLFLATNFNNWFDATKDEKFQLKYTIIHDEPYFAVKFPLAQIPEYFQFKFVSSTGEWIGPEIDTPNKINITGNICNYYFDAKKTGEHIIALNTNEALFPCDKIIMTIGQEEHIINILPWLFSLYTNVPLGANIQKNRTKFRVFIPRAYSARVLLYRDINSAPKIFPMNRKYDHTWETIIEKNLHGYFYHYQALFPDQTNWENAPKILDPYAKATYSANGPGIILKQRTFLPLRDNFATQQIKDDIILESHVHDLLKHAPVKLKNDQRRTFNGLSKWLSKKHCYIRQLGINTLELQPIQEPDAANKNVYHWGYMPVNFFSPASIYTSSPKKAPNELKKFVRTCHRVNIAVLMDVVYNHVGSPNHLYNIDPDYFFRKNTDNTFQNFSGCGNDLRTESPMVQRLIIDSLKHFITTYRIDGFRFDLAELLGQEFLHKLESELRMIKNDIQIIYEPWSFRGNIGKQLKSFSGSAWNDEYREFIADYVRGNGNAEGIEYFLKGSPDYRTHFPYQTINYIASHNDRCWIDKITENINFDGSSPTTTDIKRTHLALAIMMMSFGVPMLAAGQDILFSKHGHCNTYQSGEINALDYKLLSIHSSTHKFFKHWIRFRLSRRGEIIRLLAHPTKNYTRFFRANDHSAIGVLYNADRSLKGKQIFFTINPHNYDLTIDLENFQLKNFRKLSDIDIFYKFSKRFNDTIINRSLFLPALSLGLWIE